MVLRSQREDAGLDACSTSIPCPPRTGGQKHACYDTHSYKCILADNYPNSPWRAECPCGPHNHFRQGPWHPWDPPSLSVSQAMCLFCLTQWTWFVDHHLHSLFTSHGVEKMLIRQQKQLKCVNAEAQRICMICVVLHFFFLSGAPCAKKIYLRFYSSLLHHTSLFCHVLIFDLWTLKIMSEQLFASSFPSLRLYSRRATTFAKWLHILWVTHPKKFLQVLDECTELKWHDFLHALQYTHTHMPRSDHCDKCVMLTLSENSTVLGFWNLWKASETESAPPLWSSALTIPHHN